MIYFPLRLISFLLIFLLYGLPYASLVLADSTSTAKLNGFNLAGTLIPKSEILSGGPPKDGIPAINRPKFITSEQAHFLDDSDRVLGVVIDGIAKAYPVRILNWHEIVNDRLGDQSFVVTFCPLCGTGVVFNSKFSDDSIASFGVSGLLYNSDVLLYDRETESLWSQILKKAVTGPLKGQLLTMIPVQHTTWSDWQSRYPSTSVLSTDTGFVRDYNRNPYEGYERSRRLYFTVSRAAPSRYHPKERVLGVEINGQFKAYPFLELNRNKQDVFEDQLAGENYQVHWDSRAENAYITNKQGELLPAIVGFWFAWYTFHPSTQVFSVP